MISLFESLCGLRTTARINNLHANAFQKIVVKYDDAHTDAIYSMSKIV